ncbi:MAG TPA: 4'-phosphopantetheinyl transferase superfamily protein [Flavobacterium sp.]|nr:4'-phosphopantetheinyl transferase superfamily protein [Flavobacterium sp.]
MIGNDIVDLTLAAQQSNWQRPGFLRKIFTEFEQLLITESLNRDLMVWMLWSRKEAAYKIFNRQTNLRLYNPLDFECSAMTVSAGFHYGTVSGKNALYYTKTEATTAFVHTIATTNPDDFARIYPLKNEDAILKKGNIPYLFSSSDARQQPVSISHHGQFRRVIAIN